MGGKSLHHAEDDADDANSFVIVLAREVLPILKEAAKVFHPLKKGGGGGRGKFYYVLNGSRPAASMGHSPEMSATP